KPYKPTSRTSHILSLSPIHNLSDLISAAEKSSETTAHHVTYVLTRHGTSAPMTLQDSGSANGEVVPAGYSLALEEAAAEDKDGLKRETESENKENRNLLVNPCFLFISWLT